MIALSKLMYDVQSVADFLSKNEIAITQVLEAEAKEKPAGKTCEAPDGLTPQHNG